MPAQVVPASIDEESDRARAGDLQSEGSLITCIQKDQIATFSDFYRAQFVLEAQDARGVVGCSSEGLSGP